MKFELTNTGEMQLLCCGNCGVSFAIPFTMYEALRRSRDTFHCPNGHARHFTSKTDAEKLREVLEVERAHHNTTRENCATAERGLKRAKREIAKLRGAAS